MYFLREQLFWSLWLLLYVFMVADQLVQKLNLEKNNIHKNWTSNQLHNIWD